MTDIQEILHDALSSRSESLKVEFKEFFDRNGAQDWCEIIKDIVALANTSGGAIVFGLGNDGEPSGYDVDSVLSVDPAEFTDKIYKYTNQQFSDFQLVQCEKAGTPLAALVIGLAPLPIVFEKPGTYNVGQGKQRSAFSAGSTYFRHGAKSEPGNTDDVRQAFERKLARVREDWLKNVRQVIEAPLGARVVTIRPDADASALGVRLTDDPDAPTIGVLSPDVTHPFRQKELIAAVNQLLPAGVAINQYDILCIRKTFGIDEKATFHYLPKFGSHQYSSSFADWIVQQYQADNDFFTKTRQTVHDSRRPVQPES